MKREEEVTQKRDLVHYIIWYKIKRIDLVHYIPVLVSLFFFFLQSFSLFIVYLQLVNIIICIFSNFVCYTTKHVFKNTSLEVHIIKRYESCSQQLSLAVTLKMVTHLSQNGVTKIQLTTAARRN